MFLAECDIGLFVGYYNYGLNEAYRQECLGH
jgi:hypothetical protein